VSLLEQAGADSNEHGWVLVAQAQAGSDLEDQQRLYVSAIEAVRRCGDPDLECDALASLGIMLAFSGHVNEGMTRLDEALAVICAGEHFKP
jgi:replication-associated recombination protein RarA